ncbi:hypothetical protein ADUPG1_010125, partial [Aduncisulcus paluster]
ESIREFTEEEDGEDKTSWLDKIWEICSQSSSNTFTITADDVTHLCMIGKGGFGEAILVRHVEDKRGGEFVLKRMENDGSAPTVGDAYKKEFQKQMKLYNNPNCFHRIPQPICLFDDLDDDNCGIYGFCMEFCQGGSISEFSEKWCRCAGGSEDSISDCDTDYIRSRVNPMDLDPLRVSALCVGMIECLAEVMRANKKLMHRDVKPDNFLVRVDSEGECGIVLADLGFTEICGASSSTMRSRSSRSKPTAEEEDDSARIICGTFVYNSLEALLSAKYSRKSDGYALAMSMLALFICDHPFMTREDVRDIRDPIILVQTLCDIIQKDPPHLSDSPLFQSLRDIESGKYEEIYDILNEVFEGLTKIDRVERLSVRKAHDLVKPIKHLLPKIGQGWTCPKIDEIIQSRIDQFGEMTVSGTIENCDIDSEDHVSLREGSLKIHHDIADKMHSERNSSPSLPHSDSESYSSSSPRDEISIEIREKKSRELRRREEEEERERRREREKREKEIRREEKRKRKERKKQEEDRKRLEDLKQIQILKEQKELDSAIRKKKKRKRELAEKKRKKEEEERKRREEEAKNTHNDESSDSSHDSRFILSSENEYASDDFTP